MEKYLHAKNILKSLLIKQTIILLTTVLIAGLSSGVKASTVIPFSQASPTITSFSPASGPVGTLVTINGTNLDSPTAFTIGGVTALVISNTGTVLTGLVMPGAITGAVSVTTAGGTVSGGSNFTLTAPVPPTAQQGNKLIGTGSVGAGLQGVSVAVSADGNTAIVGAYYDNTYQGAVWIYTRSGGVWSQQGNKLVGTGSIGGAQQGKSVAISADGNTAIVGGFADNTIDGAAWIYTRSGGTWSQQGNKLVGSASSEFGSSVSLSADGNTAIVGASNDNGSIGSVWVFTRSGGIWSQQGSKLAGTGATANAFLGYSSAISADGNTIIAGGKQDNNGQGAAWIFTNSGGTWSQQGSKLVGTGAIGAANQGFSVAINADGNTALIGGAVDNGGQGAAWVYTRSGGTWSQQGSKLVGAGNVGAALQGFSVALSADGNIAIVGGAEDANTGQAAGGIQSSTPIINGANNKNGETLADIHGNTAIIDAAGSGSSNVGATWVFTRSGGTWNQVGNKLIGTGSSGGALEGYSVAISADGSTAIIGGPGDNSNVGAVWAFIPAVPPVITSFSPASGAIGTLVTVNGTNLNSPTVFTIGGVTALVISNTGTQLTGFVMPGATTGAISLTTVGGTGVSGSNFTVTPTPYPSVQQGSKLTGTNDIMGDLGSAIAVSADGNTAIVGGAYDNNTIGAAWIFVRSGGVWTQQGNKLLGTGSVGLAQQGWSVALSADGNTALVGANNDNSGVGAVWVYTRTAGVWTQQGNKLVGTGNTGLPYQGISVSLSADGNTAIVGASQDNSQQGAAWVYTRTADVWTQQGSKLVGTGSVGTIVSQGLSVALSADGNTALVGGPGDNSNQGAVWVYTNSGGVWIQQGSKLTGTGNASAAKQGYSVSLSADGNTAIEGGNQDNGSKGAAWVFTRSGSTWTQQGSKLFGTGSVGYYVNQGTSVSLTADGNTALVGGYSDNGSGATWVYTRSAGTWSQQGNKLVGTGSTIIAFITPNQGFSVAISADGGTAMVGGPGDNTAQGAAWVFIPGLTNNANLAALTITGGTLAPVFSASTFSYTASVANATSNITVTPTSSDAGATVTVNGTAVASGSASGPIALSVGANTITVVVTAQDGTTTQTYTITVTRALANQTITFAALPTKTYGNADFAPGATSDNNTIPITYTSDNTAVATIVSGNIHIVGVGTANITAAQAGNASYNAATSQTQQLTVNKGVQTITFTAAALPAKTYGNADFASGATSDNNSITITYSSDNTAVATIVNGNIHIVGAGTANITASQAGNTNYNAAASQTQQLTVNKAPQTITFAAIPTQNKGAQYDLSGVTSSSGLSVTLVSASPLVASIQGSTLTALQAGSSVITVSQAGNANYLAATSVTQTVTVTDPTGDDIIVHQAVSPNGDGINDFLLIEGIQII